MSIEHDKSGPTGQRRLQRPADFTGLPLTSFSSVVKRHGLPVALIALFSLLLAVMDLPIPVSGLEPALSNTYRYTAVGIVIFIALFCYGLYLRRGPATQVFVWVVYLGLVSLWEEWVFRVIMPHFLQQFDIPLAASIVLSNLAFGAMHYFTLRWKWHWCLLAFLGGIALSRQFALHEDFLWLVGVHWIATFINTPRMPAKKGA